MQERTINCRWLSDGIGADYEEWRCSGTNSLPRPPNHIFIESPTGTGKTSFIINKLLPFAAKHQRNILYLGNRSALADQMKIAVANHLIEIVDGAPLTEDLHDYRRFQHPTSRSVITLLNYQAFFSFEKQLSREPIYYYVIFDEAHFFLEDALFNSRTYLLFERIIRTFFNAVTVFMSATLSEYISLFYESTLYARAQIPNLECFGSTRQVQLTIYRNQYESNAFRPIFYNNESDVVRAIGQAPRNDRWIIFTHSKQKGKWAQERIRSETNRTVQFLSAEQKNTVVWKTLVKEECFESDILIATSVIDNGVNINDPSVNHIVLPFSYRTEFLQMLGRRRLQANEQISIYVQIPTIQMINSQIHQLEKRYAIMKVVSQTIDENVKTRILQDLWTRGDTATNALFYINNHRELKGNPFALCKINYLLEFYADLLEHAKEPQYYQKVALSWLNLSLDNISYLTNTRATSLIELLHSQLNTLILPEHQEAFYQDFQHFYKIHCYQLYENNKPELANVLSVKKGPAIRKSTINRELELLNLPFSLKKKNNSWVLQTL